MSKIISDIYAHGLPEYGDAEMRRVMKNRHMADKDYRAKHKFISKNPKVLEKQKARAAKALAKPVFAWRDYGKLDCRKPQHGKRENCRTMQGSLVSGKYHYKPAKVTDQALLSKIRAMESTRNQEIKQTYTPQLHAEGNLVSAYVKSSPEFERQQQTLIKQRQDKAEKAYYGNKNME